ncbi:IscS subfamily cysteine desulfurase [Neobacillus sp. LXY-4]|uniref:IscS subfamily cysteine desulfurase n=1 Tax=Neobacillus sp. LXY-4 TaxID=3379826 RepID=UPI003EE34D4C
MKYLDYAATCPLDEEAANIYVKVATQYFGNSNSLHDIGEEARNLLEGCRAEFSRILGVEKDGVFFTSGGSEGNFLAIEALLSCRHKAGSHIITSIAEHSSIHSVMERMERSGYRITYLPFNEEGLIETKEFAKAITDDTVLAVIQHGNSEIGTIQPIAEIGEICKERNILFHSDCVQTFGKLDLKEISPFVDSLAISGHKVYGPKGTGAVYLRPQVNWAPFFPSTTHEKGFRPGTVNVPGIAALTIAAKKAHEQLHENKQKYLKLRNIFLDALSSFQHSIQIHGSIGPNQLSSIIGMSMNGIEGQWVLLECNRNGYAISTGSACHSGMLTPALAMKALRISGKKAKEYFRISFGRDTSEEDMKNLAQLLVKIGKLNKL